jgi:hypothetical protein
MVSMSSPRLVASSEPEYVVPESREVGLSSGRLTVESRSQLVITLSHVVGIGTLSHVVGIGNFDTSRLTNDLVVMVQLASI